MISKEASSMNRQHRHASRPGYFIGRAKSDAHAARQISSYLNAPGQRKMKFAGTGRKAIASQSPSRWRYGKDSQCNDYHGIVSGISDEDYSNYFSSRRCCHHAKHFLLKPATHFFAVRTTTYARAGPRHRRQKHGGHDFRRRVA